jgi:hypothetical protein
MPIAPAVTAAGWVCLGVSTAAGWVCLGVSTRPHFGLQLGRAADCVTAGCSLSDQLDANVNVLLGLRAIPLEQV